MKDKLRALVIPILLVLTTFFSYGCTVGQRKELMDELGSYVKAEGVKILTAAAQKAAEVAEAKIAEMEKKKLDELDQQLAIFSTKDPVTGVESKITWKKFDGDGDGKLSPAELSSVGFFVTTELARRIASGEMSKDDIGKTGKNVGFSLAALLALWGASKGVGAVVKKKNGGGSGGGDPPPDPAQPPDPAVPPA